jgi:O-acetyl-ADP-ribose deacetylase (regulator of RNase III)
VWRGGDRGESDTLASAYRESLVLAAEAELESVAFPSISTGAYGYPVRRAADVALRTARDRLAEDPGSVREVRWVLFDDATHAAYESALEELAART